MVLHGFAMFLLGVAMVFLWFLGGLWAVRIMSRRLGVKDHEQILGGLHLGQE